MNGWFEIWLSTAKLERPGHDVHYPQSLDEEKGCLKVKNRPILATAVFAYLLAGRRAFCQDKK